MPISGFNEATLLAALADGNERKLSEVVAAIENMKLDRDISETTAHITLQRMVRNGLVAAVKREITSRDGRQRIVWFYVIEVAGIEALGEAQREAAAWIKATKRPTLRPRAT